MAARKAGQIVISLSAGTAQFVRDMDTASAKVREFGGHNVSGMRAASAAIRTFEGNVTNNVRAVEAFLSNTLKLGPVLQAAFPIIGAVAFAGLIGEIGGKVNKLIQDIQQAPEKIRGSFQELNAPLTVTNQQLQVTNDRISNDIAKLEGRRQNTLKLALDEAKLAAEQLAGALDKDLAAVDKLLKENASGSFARFFDRFMGSSASTTAQGLREEIGGATGFGGFRGSIAGITDPAQLKTAYEAEIAKIRSMYQAAFRSVTVNTAKGQITRNEVDPAVGELFEGLIKNLQEELNHIALQVTNTALTGQKNELQAHAEQMRPLIELEHQLAEVRAQGAAVQENVLAKIAVEEQGEIQRYAELHQLNARTLPLIQQIYDAKRIAAYNEYLKTTQKTLDELADRWTHLELSARKALGEAHNKEIEQGTEILKRRAEEVTKVAKQINQITAEADKAALQHQMRLIGLAPGAANNPLGTLAKQQALEKIEIEKRYNEQLQLATTPLEKARILQAKNLELTKLQYEYEEKQAEVRQKGVRDFFAEMQGDAQKFSNILYQGMHSAVDRLSGELASLWMGQKTNFKAMITDIGHQILQQEAKAELQKGLGTLGKVFGINIPAGKPDGSSESLALWVKPVGGAPGSPAGIPGGGGGGVPLPGQHGGIFSGSDLGGLIFHFAGGRASGGSVSPGSAYLVGEHGAEPFFPSTSGTIMSNAVARRTFGAGGPVISVGNIDARGADPMQTEQAVKRAMREVYGASVSTSVRVNQQQQIRTPQLSR